MPMARQFRGSGHILRFIEYMDVGNSNGWRMEDVVPAAEMVAAVDAVWPLEPAEPNYFGEVAERWRYRDGAGRDRGHRLGDAALLRELHPGPPLGRRASSTPASSPGWGTTCGAPLRAGATDEEIEALLRGTWGRRADRYSEIRTEETPGAARGAGWRCPTSGGR